MAAPGERKYLVRVIFSCIGIFVGLSIFFVFGINYKNWNTSFWGLLSAIPAAVTLHVHRQHRRRGWEGNPERLRSFMLAGCFIQLIGVCGFVTYLTLAITQKQGLIAYGNGYYVTSVWCFMVWKWGFLLFYFSRKYFRQYGGVYTILPKDEEDVANSYGS